MDEIGEKSALLRLLDYTAEEAERQGFVEAARQIESVRILPIIIHTFS